jgi:hypothetical protein
MLIDSILLLWRQSLDVKLLRNKFKKQLTDVVSDINDSHHKVNVCSGNSNINSCLQNNMIHIMRGCLC